MKRRTLTFICVAVSVLLLPAMIAVGDSNWTFLGDEYYRQIPSGNTSVILADRMQTSDYESVRQKLIDTEKESLTAEEMQRISTNSNAVIPANLTADGYFLKENWVELRQEYVAERLTVTTLSNVLNTQAKSQSQTLTEEFSVEIPGTTNGLPISLRRVFTNGGEGKGTVTVLPANLDDCAADFHFSNDGEYLYLATSHGLWAVEAKTKNVIPLSYDKMAYATKVKESIAKWNENRVNWVSTISPSPESGKVAYVSNRNTWDISSDEVFYYDLESKKEYKFKSMEGAQYLIEDWIDENTLLCTVLRDGKREIVVLGTDGTEILLNAKGENPTVYAVEGSNIAYAESLSSPTLHIVQYVGESSLKEVTTQELGEGTRLRRGVNGFSPSGSKYAALYVPENDPENRNVRIVDLQSSEIRTVTSPTTLRTLGKEVYILECSWVDENTLLFVTGDRSDPLNTLSSWLFEL